MRYVLCHMSCKAISRNQALKAEKEYILAVLVSSSMHRKAKGLSRMDQPCFVVRNVEEKDISFLCQLAEQSPLINLPPCRATISEKIQKSLDAFAGDPPPCDAEYVFVIEDLSCRAVVGVSLIIAQYATPQCPYYYYQTLTENTGEGASPHQNHSRHILRLCVETTGWSTIGGLVLDRGYRGLPQKLGKQISLIRFVYMGMFPERFNRHVLSEIMPILAPDGSSPFWEALGKRFTGMEYSEAFQLCRGKNRGFIEAYFPREDVCPSFSDPAICLGPERMAEFGREEKHIVEKAGLRFLNRLDPMDGALHYGAELSEIAVIQRGAFRRAQRGKDRPFNDLAFIGISRQDRFLGGRYPVRCEPGLAYLPDEVMKLLAVEEGESIYVSTVD